MCYTCVCMCFTWGSLYHNAQNGYNGHPPILPLASACITPRITPPELPVEDQVLKNNTWKKQAPAGTQPQFPVPSALRAPEREHTTERNKHTRAESFHNHVESGEANHHPNPVVPATHMEVLPGLIRGARQKGMRCCRLGAQWRSSKDSNRRCSSRWDARSWEWCSSCCR